ncbi:MAG: MarR family transcriptional regulator [Hadesarchaea archaeon]|nr:MarR family transcriptional regulator [Hadesarchaea archaeon]
MREIHIWEFPEHFRVLATTHFLKESRNLSLGGMQISREYLVGNLFMPVSIFKRLAQELVLTGRYASLREVEHEVLAYKACSTSKPIWQPVLPLRDTPTLAELYAHLVADGGVSKHSIPHYVNSSPALIQRFSYLLRKAFGQVHQVIYWNKRGAYDLRFSNTAWEVLSWIYGSNVSSKTAKLPRRLLTPKLREAVLRAFIDDEGCVDLNKRVSIGLANQKLLRQLHRVAAITVGAAHLTPIRKQPRVEYFRFYIRSTGIGRIARLKLYDVHKKRKINFLLKTNNSPGDHRRPGETQKLLATILRHSGGATISELSRRLHIRPSNVSKPLYKLLGKGVVEFRHNGNGLYWSIHKDERD